MAVSDENWQLINERLYLIAQNKGLKRCNQIDIDDVVAMSMEALLRVPEETIDKLCHDPYCAKKYLEKVLIQSMMKVKGFERYENEKIFRVYSHISRIAKKYSISIEEKNAYKFSVLLDDEGIKHSVATIEKTIRYVNSMKVTKVDDEEMVKKLTSIPCKKDTHYDYEG